MKKVLIILFVFASLSFAQMQDVAIVTADSIDLHSIVANQIAAAIEKSQNEKLNPKPIIEEKKAEAKPVVIKKEKEVQAKPNLMFSFIAAQPWQYVAFALSVMVIFSFVAARRIVLSFTRTSSKKLKKKIGLMREEKIGGSKENPKLSKTRKVLKENLEMLKNNELQLGKRARQLNISKGELQLAARLKLYEFGKM